MSDRYYNKIDQIRVTPLLVGGAEDPSATAVTAKAREFSADFVYIDGDVLEHTAGSQPVCQITEEDTPVGADIKLEINTVDYEVKTAIAGGTPKMSGEDYIGWEMGMVTAGPFKLEVWSRSYDASSSLEGNQDKYIKTTCNYCTGRPDSKTQNEKDFDTGKFAIKARQNPSSGDTPYEEEDVAAIV